jgi:hypothetical protein
MQESILNQMTQFVTLSVLAKNQGKWTLFPLFAADFLKSDRLSGFTPHGRTGFQTGVGFTMKWGYAFLLCTFALLALLLRPVDTLVIRCAPETEALFMAPAPLGQEFSTEYIHSVQLTPVHDVYRIVNGRIWSWQERVMSHNAGLPFASPPFGRFRAEPPWMVFEGGRQSLENFFLRVGDAKLGRNVFSYGAQASRTALYERFPGKRLQLFVERRPLMALIARGPARWRSDACSPAVQSGVAHFPL